MNGSQPFACPAGASSGDPDRGGPESPGAGVDTAARTERHLRMLEELGERGMELARMVHGQAMAQAAAEPAAGEEAGAPQRRAGELAAVFARVARAVRLTVALEAKLAEDRETRNAARLVEERQRATVAAQERRQRQRRQVERGVERLIEAETLECEHAGFLRHHLEQRLSDPDSAPIDDRRIGEIAAAICRDLDIAFDRSVWDGEETAEPAEAVAEAGTRMPQASAPSVGRTLETGDRVAAPLSRRAASGSDPPTDGT